MLDQTTTGADLYARPTEIDDGAYLRIRQIRPVERAAAPIVDHNIQLTETAVDVRPWYRGETRIEPSAYMSILLDPCRNNAVGTLSGFVSTLKAFSRRIPKPLPCRARAGIHDETPDYHARDAL